MLGKTEAFSGFSVPDIDAAKEFYGETLGLEVTEEPPGLLSLKLATGAAIMVYPKPDHKPAVFTILNFPVDDLEETVDGLAERGVTFERYEGFDQDDRGIAKPPEDGQGPDIAWFKDPAGNILAVMSG